VKHKSNACTAEFTLVFFVILRTSCGNFVAQAWLEAASQVARPSPRAQRGIPGMHRHSFLGFLVVEVFSRVSIVRDHVRSSDSQENPEGEAPGGQPYDHQGISADDQDFNRHCLPE
jgi:hypothetical protein